LPLLASAAKALETRVLRSLLIACAFLTRLPVRTGELRPEQFGPAAACFPVIGLGLGVASFGIHAACAPFLGANLTAFALVAFSAIVTGGLHLDGLADWFDAVGGGRGDPKRMLEIMRDSRIGAHGASALVLLLIGKVSALSELPSETLSMGLICAPAAARGVAVWLLYAYPSARDDGLGQSFAQQVKRPHALIAGGIVCVVAAVFGFHALLPLLLCAASGWMLGAWAKARLGGITGDVCGAAIELGELAFLLGCRAL
jgi:adenosylcobinamide-GDP ribazoletransferase